MTGLWPRLRGLQESCWRAKGTKGEEIERKMESTTATCQHISKVWRKHRSVEFNSLHFSKMQSYFLNVYSGFSARLFNCVFLQWDPISALTMFNKCLIGWVHESQSTLASPLSVYWTVSVYVNERWLATLPLVWSQWMLFIHMKKKGVSKGIVFTCANCVVFFKLWY